MQVTYSEGVGCVVSDAWKYATTKRIYYHQD